MTVMRFDPFRDFDRFTEQLFGGARGMRTMPMEAYRRGDQLFIHLDLPGVNPDDVDLTLERNVISIRAERRSPRQEGDQALIDERPEGSFSRQLFLGDNLAVDQLNASYDMGVLTLMIPVAEQAKPRRIEVGVRSQGPQPVETTGGGQGSTADQPGSSGGAP